MKLRKHIRVVLAATAAAVIGLLVAQGLTTYERIDDNPLLYVLIGATAWAIGYAVCATLVRK